MPWFAVCDAASGALVSVGEVVPTDGTGAPVNPVGYEIHALGDNAPDLARSRWDPALRAFVADIPVRLEWSPVDWMARFTPLEQVAFERALRAHPDENLRDALAVIDKQLSRAGGVRVDDPRTRTALETMAAAGVIAPARVAELLLPDPLP